MSALLVWDLIRFVHFFSLALWLGGLFYFALIGAPTVRTSMASRAVTHQIISKSLKRLNQLEIVCCLLLIATLVLARHFIQSISPLYVVLGGVFCMGLITSLYAFYITPKMELLRMSPGFESLPAEHVSKRGFFLFHKIYVRLMTLNFILGSVILYCSMLILKS